MSLIAERPGLLRDCSHFALHRNGRFLVAELKGPHLVLSTSIRNGGQSDAVRYLVNHQSCEARGHRERYEAIHAGGLRGYHDRVCAQVGLDPAAVALMGTAANMNYASIVCHASSELEVTAVVTAGVGGNAACAADPTSWVEGRDGYRKIAPHAGTINTMLLLNRALTPHALAGAAMALAEGKGAALQRLAIRSRYSREFATGTNTDQYCIACGADSSPALTNAGTGVHTGELIGRAVRDAVIEALRWQNGLEPSYARSLFHILGVYGVREEGFIDAMAPYLGETHLQLLKENMRAVVYEPLLASAAFAMAALLDRHRHGMLPESAVREALRQQAATMACGLAALPSGWAGFHAQFAEIDLQRPHELVLRAIALGWAAKWT